MRDRSNTGLSFFTLPQNHSGTLTWRMRVDSIEPDEEDKRKPYMRIILCSWDYNSIPGV